jgi:thiol-disulfide isomerase/thioredoxin
MFKINCIIIGLLLVACGSGMQTHGRVSALSLNTNESSKLCEHKIPQDVCTRCNPKRINLFKKVNDWCAPHEVPESQCYLCHPNLSFKPLPKAPKDSDIKEIKSNKAPERLADLSVSGKVTVVDVWALWCMPCRRVTGDLNLLLRHNKNLAVRKIELLGWEDSFASKILAGSPKLPLLVVFDTKGKEVGRVMGHKPAELELLIKKANQF